MTNTFRKNMLWNAFGNLVYLGLQWIVTVMVTRLGKFEMAGILSLAMSISATFQTVALFGIRNFQVSDIDNQYSDTCYCGLRVITCAAAMAACMIYSFIAGYHLYQISAIFWFMGFRLAENFSDVLHGIAQKHERIDIAGKAFFVKGICSTAAFFIGFLLSDHNLTLAIACMALFSIASTALYDYRMVRKLSDFVIQLNFRENIALARETFILCIYQFMLSLIATLPKIILARMYDETSLGAYSSIFAPALLVQAAALYIYVPFATQFSRYWKENQYKDLIRLAWKISLGIAAVCAAILAVAAVLGEWGLNLIFGETILEYSYLLIPIILCVFTTAYFSFLGMLETIIRDFKGLILSCAAGVAACYFLVPLMIQSVGLNGTSFGLIAANLTAIATSAWFLSREIRREKFDR